jgi:hypothetical protein
MFFGTMSLFVPRKELQANLPQLRWISGRFSRSKRSCIFVHDSSDGCSSDVYMTVIIVFVHLSDL